MTDTNLNIWNVRFDGGGDKGTMSWTTNQSSNSRVEYGTSPSFGRSQTDGRLVTDHKIELTGLEPNKNYFYRVRSEIPDGAGASEDGSFRNPPNGESFFSDARYEGGADRGIIEWSTVEPSDSQVEYGTTQRYGFQTPLERELVTFHTVVLTGFRPDTRYFYRLKSRNSAGRLRFYESGFYNPWEQP
jgi:phosphodiesterase/alkaline phosphatase D-like protein